MAHTMLSSESYMSLDIRRRMKCDSVSESLLSWSGLLYYPKLPPALKKNSTNPRISLPPDYSLKQDWVELPFTGVMAVNFSAHFCGACLISKWVCWFIAERALFMISVVDNASARIL